MVINFFKVLSYKNSRVVLYVLLDKKERKSYATTTGLFTLLLIRKTSHKSEN